MPFNVAVVLVGDRLSVLLPGCCDGLGINRDALVHRCAEGTVCEVTLDRLLDGSDLVPVSFVVMFLTEEFSLGLAKRGHRL